MNTQSLNELIEFHRFVGEKVSNGGANLSPEEVLDEWRLLHPDDDDMAAIQEAIDDLENGDVGIPLEEFDREIHAKYNLPPRS